jgi:hypothetical protein
LTVSAYPRAPVASPSAADLSRREHRFFTRSTVVIALLVVIGFGFSTYVRTRPGATAFGGPTLKPLVRIHAAVTTAWIALLVFQSFWLRRAARLYIGGSGSWEVRSRVA